MCRKNVKFVAMRPPPSSSSAQSKQ